MSDENDLIGTLDSYVLAYLEREDGTCTNEFESVWKNEVNKIKDEHTILIDTYAKKVAYNIKDPS